MYRPDCGPVHGVHGLLCLSLVGWLFTIVFTYTGFACMVAGGPPQRPPAPLLAVCVWRGIGGEVDAWRACADAARRCADAARRCPAGGIRQAPGRRL
jgi:hypothetical protein